MARTLVLLLPFLAFVMSHISAEKPEATVAIHITGKVLCQDCSTGFNEWLKGARPIKGAVVAVVCMDGRGRASHYTRDETDGKGEYNIVLSKTVEGEEIKPQSCSVRLVSSPDEACNVPTNSDSGLSGVRLRRPSVVYRELVKYVLQPFYYTTPMCQKPETRTTKY